MESSYSGDHTTGDVTLGVPDPATVAPIPEYDVFISFRGGDRPIARDIERELRRRTGARVFLDERSVMPGADWQEDIVGSLERSRSVIALIGPAWHLVEDRRAVDWVEKELDAARSNGIGILPVLAGDPAIVRPKLGAEADWFTNQAVQIDATPTSTQLRKIVSALSRMGVLPTGDRSVDLRQADCTIDEAAQNVIDLLTNADDHHLVMVRGGVSSGRWSVIEKVAKDLAARDGGEAYVVLGGLARPSEAASRFSVVTNGFCDLVKHILDGRLGDSEVTGAVVSKLALAHARSLIARGVLPADEMLAIANDADDRLVLELLRSRPLNGIDSATDQLLTESLRLVTAILDHAQKTVVFLINNIDTVDTGSQEVIARLHQHLRVRVVATARPGWKPEWAPDAVAVDLHTTNTAQVRAWVEGELAAQSIQADSDVLDAIATQEPIFRMPLIWYLIDQGAVEETEVDGAVRWSRYRQESLSPKATDLVGWLFNELIPPGLRSVLRVGALMDQPFDFSIAFGVGGDRRSAQAGPAAVEQQWKRLFDADRDGFIIRSVPTLSGLRLAEFAHPVIIDLVTGQLSEQDRHTARQRIADLLAEQANDADRSIDLRIDTWEAAGTHLAQVGAHTSAALALRNAGRLAEESSASSAAQRCYEEASRALNQARLDDREGHRDADHLLLLANTCYRLTRIKGSLSELSDTAKSERDECRTEALAYLDELSRHLDDGRLQVPAAGEATLIPTASPLQHYRRMAHALAGFVYFQHALNLQDGKDDTTLPEARDALLNAIQHAEGAFGEGDSDWLLGAASSSYARALADEARLARQRGFHDRARRLQLDGFLHAERAIGVTLAAQGQRATTDEAWIRARQAQRSLLLDADAPPKLVEFFAHEDGPALKGLQPTATFGSLLWSLMQYRLSDTNYAHSRDVERYCFELLSTHAEQVVPGGEDNGLRDALSIAAAIHDWYQDIDPARLLNLARDWNLPISGAEWANPILLHGKAAVEVVRQQLAGEVRLGTEWFEVIRRMVENHTVASPTHPAEAKLFVIADTLADPVERPELRQLANTPGQLDAAFALAMQIKTREAFDHGRVIIGDTQWSPADSSPAESSLAASAEAESPPEPASTH